MGRCRPSPAQPGPAAVQPRPDPARPQSPAHLVSRHGAGKDGVEDKLLAQRNLNRQLLRRTRQVSNRLQQGECRGGVGWGRQAGSG